MLRVDSSAVGHEVLNPGQPLAFEAERWRDVLVVVQSGTLEARCRSGRVASFKPGSMLHFTGLELYSLSAAGPDPTILLTVSR
ncbi:MAG: hypothetical protein ACTHJM_14900 [Marmoricola sp.]